MNFIEIAENRQSCRKYNPEREVEQEKIDAILKAARLSPSACNGQPYHITVCRNNAAQSIAGEVEDALLNKFASDAPVMLVISEEPYTSMAALGAKKKNNDYRSIDIGILCAYITAEATVQGLGTCIIGWFDSEPVQKICSVEGKARIVITLGYAADDDKLRNKKRKDIDKLVSFVD